MCGQKENNVRGPLVRLVGPDTLRVLQRRIGLCGDAT